MEKESINRRFVEAINYLLDNKLVDSKGGFAVRMKISGTKLSEILNFRMKAGTELLARMCQEFKISSIWLLTGEGTMLRKQEKLESVVDIPTPEIKPTSVPTEGIPLIPISAMAGAFNGEQTVLEYECERFIVPTFKGAEFLISVRGSSMYPKYNSGDIVACKKVPMKDIFFQWNKVYVLDTDQGPLIKRVKPGSDENHILIVSDNANYEPFELHLNSIYNVALVLGVIRLE